MNDLIPILCIFFGFMSIGKLIFAAISLVGLISPNTLYEKTELKTVIKSINGYFFIEIAWLLSAITLLNHFI